ncbi:hypothetical protein HMPREF1580_00848 [Gardnerella vaginalis JCP8070]|nr:hypothetical protein HMPREF1580_00848 [Gardnerella vaginalis JCP8070]
MTLSVSYLNRALLRFASIRLCIHRKAYCALFSTCRKYITQTCLAYSPHI